MEFKIKISSLASQDIDEAIRYYSNYSKPTAKKFINSVKEGFEILKINPFFNIRYGKSKGFTIKEISIYSFV